MAKQILILYPDTFIWITPAKGLLYNTKKFTIKEFRITRNVLSLCERLMGNNRIRRVEINTDNLFDDEKQFMKLIISNKFGYISLPDENVRTVQNGHRPAPGLSHDKTGRNPRDILRYFSDLTIYIGGECEQTEFYKQTFYPYHSVSCLSAIDIIDFLNRIETPYLRHIHIILSDLYGKSNLSLLISWLLHTRDLITFYIPHSLTKKSFIYNTLKNLGFSVKIICRGREDTARSIREFIQLSRKYDRQGPDYHFLVTNNSEFKYFNLLVSDHFPSAGKVIPVYSHNLRFIKEKIFRNKSELHPEKVTKKQIRIHQSLNPNFFGSLTLMPDKYIYSNVNCPPLGNMQEPIREIISRELENNYAWKLIRNASPCCHCKYQWICPPPNNYEFVIGKTDLCYESALTPGRYTYG